MSKERQDIELILLEALERQVPAERTTFLDQVCGDDARMRAELESLLGFHARAGDFLQTPPLAQDVGLEESMVTEGPGTVIGRYKLLEKIGEGGMAVVYMAEQEQPIRRKVALKVIKLGMDTRQVIARFEAERQALALMDHPSIAKVLDAGATETGRPYFVMELVTGVSITDYCDRNSLSTKGRLALFIQVCQAVQHAHQKGIIHRDLKPSNVLVTHHDGRPVPKVIDFGIAKATNQRLTEKTLFTRYAHIIGTPAYMSPEQAELSDLDVDTRSDIYSLGVLLYELLTGTTPFSEEELRKAGYVEMQRVIREQEPTKPSTKLSTLGETLTDVAKRRSTSPDLLRRTVRGDLDWIVMKSLEKDRSRRYDSTVQFLHDIERHIRCEPVSAGPPGAGYQMSKFLRRHAKLVCILAAGLAVVLAGLVGIAAMYLRAERAREEAEDARADALTVSEFLTNDLLASVFPERAKSREVTVSYLLENASRNLEERFRSSPLAEAKVRETLGLTYQKMGQYQEAEAHLARALEILREHLGQDDLTTLATADRLGWLYVFQRRLEDAKPLLTEAFEKRQRILGQDHPDTLTSMLHLASVYRESESYLKGMALAERGYHIARRVLGEEHPITLDSACHLALGCLLQNRWDEAEALSIRGLEISRRVLGEEHETTLFQMLNAAWVHGQRGRLEQAMELAQTALETSLRTCGEGHPATAYALSTVGWVYFQQERYEEGIDTTRRAVDLSRRAFGDEHTMTMWCRFRLCVMYGVQGDYDWHDPLLLDLVRASRGLFGKPYPLTGFLRYWVTRRIDELEMLAAEQKEAGEQEAERRTLSKLAEFRAELNASWGNP